MFNLPKGTAYVTYSDFTKEEYGMMDDITKEEADAIKLEFEKRRAKLVIAVTLIVNSSVAVCYNYT